MENPFEIKIYNKNFEFEGFASNPVYAYFVPAWRSQGYGNFMLDADHVHSAAIQAKGSRCRVMYRGQQILSGPIRSRRGDLLPGARATYQVSDDRRLLRNTLAWVNPGNPLQATSLSALGQTWRPVAGSGSPGRTKGQYGYYLWPSASVIPTTEDAIKHIIRANLVTRLGRPVYIEPSQGRGGNIAAAGKLPRVRFESLEDVIEPMLDWSGLGIRLWQPEGGSTIHVDVYEPGEWLQELTPESGIVRYGTYAVEDPKITRGIIGGPGEGMARAFDGLAGTGNITQREIDYNDVIEVFRVASGGELDWPDGTVDLDKVAKYFPFRGAADDVADFHQNFDDAETAALAAGAPTTGLELTLAETDGFHFGGADGIQIGDKVTVKSNGQTFKNRLTQAEISFTRDNGLVVNPIVGDKIDDPDKALANAVANLAAALRKISTAR